MAFCGYLKQSTTVTIQLGPFVDEDDGKTAENGLTIEDTDVYLSKNGGALANPNDTNNAANDSLGYYTKQLDTTDTGTLGILTVVVHESGALPVRQDYQVVVAHWWDTMCSTDYLQVDVIQVESADATNTIRDSVVNDATLIDASALNALTGVSNIASLSIDAGGLVAADAQEISGDSTAADDLEAFIEALGTDDKVLISTDAQDLSGTLDVNTKTMTAGVIDSSAIGTGAIDADAIATDAIGSAELAAAAATEIVDALLTRDWTSVSGEAARSVLNALRAIRNKVWISGGTMTVTEEDDSTPAWTAAVTTDASAGNITAVDPA